MKRFLCQCGNTLHFENSRCLKCGRSVGFVPERLYLCALEPADAGRWHAVGPITAGGQHRLCANYADQAVCNWMVPDTDPHPYCRSCRLNKIIPYLGDPANRIHWCRIETAKRRMIYTLLALGLPITSKDQDPARGLGFEFLADPDPETEFDDPFDARRRVMTGHRDGTITINVAEADPSAREEIRERMHEGYRTLLGHFRHEIGHYYWTQLIEGSGWQREARRLFGDERADYEAALQRYYANGPPPDWAERHISAYAAAHPHEDWAETWAHYLHMIDTLETARDTGFTLAGPLVLPTDPPHQRASGGDEAGAEEQAFNRLLDAWASLTVAMNALNRSMGLPDAYPFVLSARVAQKLWFVHRAVKSIPPGAASDR